MTWTNTTQVNADAGVKILVHAQSGAGKTLLCATLPKPCILSAESGLLSLNKRNLEKVYGIGNQSISYEIPVFIVQSLQELRQAYQWFRNSPDARKAFKSICLDSITEMAEKWLSTLKASTKDPRQAYGQMLDDMMELVRAFRDLEGYHVYFSSKMEGMKDEVSNVIRFGPMMPGSKLGPNLPYLFDEVFYLGIRQSQDGRKERFLRTDQDLQFVAKDRSGCLDEIEPPHLWHCIHKIIGA